MYDLVLRRALIAEGRPPVDIAVSGGTIALVGEVAAGTPAGETVDCGGLVVVPGFIEPHLHLDKALLDTLSPNPEGTLAGAIEVTGRLKREFTHASVRARALRVLRWAVANGTTLIRAHPDVDPIGGLTGLDVMLELRESQSHLVDLQVVAFPQEGIERAPGTYDLLREALRRGADVVGGCAYNETDVDACRRHIDTVLGLAVEFGVPADLHADFADDTSDGRFALAGAIADATRQYGLGGRVTLGHVTSLAALPPAERAEVVARLAEAGVAVVALPATDLHIGGRGDAHAVRRGVTPVRELIDGGVVTSYSSNNVRNAFTPFGNADMLDIGLLLAQTCHMGSPADTARILAMATTEAARVTGVHEGYGIHPGARADLVVLGTRRHADVLTDRPDRRLVVKRGRVVARTVRTTELLDAPDPEAADAPDTPDAPDVLGDDAAFRRVRAA
ncbi:amidohydrolase family protein [Streptomyces sp. NBC_00102]|uniref:amidohydrolase family protein n=1 Tax=Streptomyces sp. NBC_00102 TaxID=2975652 RepID=UPI002254FB1A|nr:amidohydrolase family protein [Streptomyces sp. NBC_00102]MCX5395543.1 amidohydrolase family protein [Streptomyces sp. NBC_00102]